MNKVIAVVNIMMAVGCLSSIGFLLGYIKGYDDGYDECRDNQELREKILKDDDNETD